MKEIDKQFIVNYEHIDYVGGVYIPHIGDSKTERYIVYFAGGNELTLFNQTPLHSHELSRYCAREKFVKDWEERLNIIHKL